MKRQVVIAFSILVISCTLSVLLLVAQDSNEGDMSDEEIMLERGEYLARIARCVGCHTPYLDEFNAEELAKEQEVTLSLFGYNALDVENQLLAGGRVFNFGPAGSVTATNLTPDEETGLGSWSDEEIETAMRIGIAPDGRRLHAIMPYNSYYDWPQSDMDAIIAYLRTIPAVENEIDRTGLEGDSEPREMPAVEDLAETPSENLAERGEYLVNDVMRCAGCHTPRDPRTGQADPELLMGGGQAFEREWGIVYGGNITPHEETGIGTWSDEEIGRVFREGVRIDGRRLVLMPWQDYGVISDNDLEAVIAYMRSLDVIDNEVPAPAFEDEAFLQFVDN